ncbi:MAG: hypothetical protein Q8T08_14435 [Ignavibacteria bacterium]|nr:hypothetical protein [Ignavibacteria bacterium]
MDKYELEASEIFPTIDTVTLHELQFVKYFLDYIGVDSNDIKDIEININNQDLDTFLINVIRKYEEMNSPSDPNVTFVDNDKRNIMGYKKEG